MDRRDSTTPEPQSSDSENDVRLEELHSIRQDNSAAQLVPPGHLPNFYFHSATTSKAPLELDDSEPSRMPDDWEATVSPAHVRFQSSSIQDIPNFTDEEFRAHKEASQKRIRKIVAAIGITLTLVCIIMVAVSLSFGQKIDELVARKGMKGDGSSMFLNYNSSVGR